MDALDENRIDIAINPKLPLKSWHVQENLYREELVCVFRGDDSVSEILIIPRISGCDSR